MTARVLPVEMRERVKKVTFYPAYNYLHGSVRQRAIEREWPSPARVFNSLEKILYALTPRLRTLPAPLFAVIKSSYILIGRVLIRLRFPGFDELRDPEVPAGLQLADVLVRAAKQGERWRLHADDLHAYKFHGRWARAATEYADVVYAYALSPIYMMLHHAKPTVAIELGTMRDIPFEDTGRGRLLAQVVQRGGLRPHYQSGRALAGAAAWSNELRLLPAPG